MSRKGGTNERRGKKEERDIGWVYMSWKTKQTDWAQPEDIIIAIFKKSKQLLQVEFYASFYIKYIF